MTAAAESRSPEIAAIEIGQRLSDQTAFRQDVQADRHLGMIAVLGPALDGARALNVDMAGEGAGRDVRRRRQTGALTNFPAHGLDFIAGIEPRRAIAGRP